MRRVRGGGGGAGGGGGNKEEEVREEDEVLYIPAIICCCWARISSWNPVPGPFSNHHQTPSHCHQKGWYYHFLLLLEHSCFSWTLVVCSMKRRRRTLKRMSHGTTLLETGPLLLEDMSNAINHCNHCLHNLIMLINFIFNTCSHYVTSLLLLPSCLQHFLPPSPYKTKSQNIMVHTCVIVHTSDK